MQTKQLPVAFSGDIPKYYDSYLGPMFFEPFALDMAHRISKIQVKNILELASGTGRLTRLLYSIAKDASIIASDINPAMVKFGKEKVAQERIKWLELDAVTLPFPDKTFDCVAVQFGVMFYSNRVAAYKEAWRVLKPGGTFIFNCWDEISKNPMAEITNETLQHFFPIDTPAFYSVPFSYYDESVISSDLRKAGFKDMAIELVKLMGTSRSAGNAAMGLIHGTPTVTAIKDRDEEKLTAITDHLESQISTKFGAGLLQVPVQARVVTAVKS